MSRFVNEINDSPLAAERAEKDILGNKIDEYYSKLSLIAPQYSPESTYVFEQLVFQEDTLYKCSVNCGPEEWNQYHWTEVNDLSDYIKNLQHINLIPYGSGKYSQVSSKKVNFATRGSGGRTYYAPMIQSGYGVYYFTYIDGRSLVTMTLSPDGGDGTWAVSSISIPQDFSSVIPSDASSSNKLVTTNTLDARLANFGGFKEVQGTGSDLHPNVPSGEEDSKLIYLVRDNSATGDDKYKEWIWDSGDPEANPPVSAQWKLIGDTTMNLDGKADKVQNATSGNLAALDSSGNLMDSGVDPSLLQGLQGFQGTQIPANSDMNTYTTPGNYYIRSDDDMRKISHTPFEQMGFSSSETGKTGQSQVTVYNINGTSSGRVMQVMYTIYSTNPENDNAFGFWFRMSAGSSSQTWGTWKRLGEQDNRFWCGYKNSANYLLITVKQISGGTVADSILISFAGNQYGVMMKLCFGMNSEGGFNGSTPTLHFLETNNWANAAYNPLFTSGGGVAKYYYDSTNKLYYFLLKTTTTNRMMCTVESNNPGNYSFSTPSAAPSWLSSATDIATGHALPHITNSRVGNAIGSSTQPVYVDAGGSLIACSIKDVAQYYNTNGAEMDYTKRCHYIYDCNNGTTVKYITVDPTKMIENVAYDIGGVLLNSSAAYYISIRYTAAGSSYKVYGNRHSIALGAATTETYRASIKLVRIGTNVYVIGY